MGNKLIGSVKPISEEFIRESTTPRTDVYGQSYTYLRNNQNGANNATSDSYFAQHFRNKHYNTRPGQGPGGTSYSGIMGNNEYFINRGDNGKYMYSITKEDGTVESGEDLTSMPSHVKTGIRDTYNSHAQKYPGSRDVFDNMYSNETSSHQEGGQIKPNFLQRLEDPNRKSIPDWQDPRYISTHKMAYEYYPDDSGRAIVYPEVQEINGKLVDFTRPPYRSGAGYDSALDRGDYLIMKNLEEARKGVEGYKDRYKNLK